MDLNQSIDFMSQELDIMVTVVEGGYLLDGDTFVTADELIAEAEYHATH